MARLAEDNIDLNSEINRILTGDPDKWGHGWEKRASLSDLMLEELWRRSTIAHNNNQLVGSVLTFGVADGAAIYIVTNGRPLTLAHIDIDDGYAVEWVTINGINASYVHNAREHNDNGRGWLNRRVDALTDDEKKSAIEAIHRLIPSCF